MKNAKPLELTGTVELQAAAGEGSAAALPRFRMVAYTGGPMKVAGWRHPVIGGAGRAQPEPRQKGDVQDVHHYHMLLPDKVFFRPRRGWGESPRVDGSIAPRRRGGCAPSPPQRSSGRSRGRHRRAGRPGRR